MVIAPRDSLKKIGAEKIAWERRSGALLVLDRGLFYCVRFWPASQLRTRSERDEQMTMPKYRVTSEETICVGGRPLNPGAIFEHIGWPPIRGVVPENEEAKRITAFHREHAASGLFGERTTPWSSEHKKFLLLHRGNEIIPAASAPSANAPIYSADFDIESRAGTVPAGEKFCCLAWPNASWRPKNEAARYAFEWLQEFGDDPRRDVSPWNSYDDSLHLPDLPEIKFDRSGKDWQPFAEPTFTLPPPFFIPDRPEAKARRTRGARRRAPAA